MTELIQLHREKYEAGKRRAAGIRVRVVRELRLIVGWVPETDDPAHTLIKGVPGKLDRSPEELKEAERLAELLAAAATPYNFPQP